MQEKQQSRCITDLSLGLLSLSLLSCCGRPLLTSIGIMSATSSVRHSLGLIICQQAMHLWHSISPFYPTVKKNNLRLIATCVAIKLYKYCSSVCFIEIVHWRAVTTRSSGRAESIKAMRESHCIKPGPHQQHCQSNRQQSCQLL